MSESAHRLRALLEAYLLARAASLIGPSEDPDPVAGALALSRRFAFLGSEDALSVAASLAPGAPVEAQESRAMRAHLAHFRQLVPRARRRAIRAEIFTRVLDVAGEPMSWSALAPELARGQARPGLDSSLARAVAPELPELEDLATHAPDAPPAVRESAREWLEATDDLHGAAMSHVAPEATECTALMAALARDCPWRPRARLRRASERLLPLGLSSLLQRVRLMPARHDALLGLRVVGVRPPHELRMAPPPTDLGVLSEVAAAHAVGEAAARLLVAPALPAALRWDVGSSVPWGFGGLSAQVLGTPESLAVCVGVREGESASRRLGALLSTAVRVSAAYALWAGTPRTAQAAGEALSRALAFSVEPGLALLLAPYPADAAPRFEAARDALGIWAALRERHDQDWYRNPRAADELRAAAGRGGGLSSQEWLEELGGGTAGSLGRVHELFPA